MMSRGLLCPLQLHIPHFNCILRGRCHLISCVHNSSRGSTVLVIYSCVRVHVPASLNKLVIDVPSHHVMADDHFLHHRIRHGITFTTPPQRYRGHTQFITTRLPWQNLHVWRNKYWSVTLNASHYNIIIEWVVDIMRRFPPPASNMSSAIMSLRCYISLTFILVHSCHCLLT